MGACQTLRGGFPGIVLAQHIPELAACAVFYGGRIKLTMGPSSIPPIELAANIRCPVAGFFGDEDSNPTPGDVDDYQAALEAAGVPHEFYRYAEAGHLFD
ncbi:MAG: dienelactone hydrolase family protein [Pseudomonadales bacterium]